MATENNQVRHFLSVGSEQGEEGKHLRKVGNIDFHNEKGRMPFFQTSCPMAYPLPTG
jgi:hypothetical protein